MTNRFVDSKQHEICSKFKTTKCLGSKFNNMTIFVHLICDEYARKVRK